jgi:hypothetical protein
MNFIQVLILLPNALRFNNSITKTFGSKSKLLILGNGPSLFETLDKHITEKLDNYDILCVNGFALTDKYTTIKPTIYIMVDPSYFSKTKIERVELSKIEIFNAIFHKTQWELNIFLPHAAMKSNAIEILRKNRNIKIVYFFNNSVFGGHEFMNRIYYNLGIANPFYQNVLISAIFLGIKSGFKDIRLIGADHSWLEGYKIGFDNKLYLIDNHFDNHAIEPILLTKLDGSNIKLHEELFWLHRCFAVYQQLDNYAKTKRINIMNCTKNSWIDAFQRGTLY